jgi:GDP-L-fucose synthase
LAGHNGLVGSAIHRELLKNGFCNVIAKAHSELDLTRQEAVERFFKNEKPEYVILSAGKVGGIGANSKYSADFYYVNTMIAANIIHSAFKFDVKKLL